MNKIETFEQFLSGQSGQISFVGFLINLVLTAVLTFLLSELYTRYGRSLSNRKLFAQNFMVLALTTMIIITIIKSSLALSLGLVGALSIIRFRSAIKEPEELTYVFVCISIGLGMGASQGLITITGFLFVAGLVILRSKNKQVQDNHNLHLTVSANNTEAVSLDKIVKTLGDNSLALDLKRIDENKDMLEVAFLVEFKDFAQLESAKSSLRSMSESVSVSFMDNKGVI